MRRKIMYVSLVVIFLLLTVISIFLPSLMQSRMAEGRPIYLFNHTLVFVTSGSMMPEINPGDAVLVEKVNDETVLSEGDVVVYISDNVTLPIIHRITEIDNGVYTMKGDANRISDIPVLRSDITGKYKALLPGFGNVITGVLNSKVLAIVIPVVGAVLSAFLIYLSFKKTKYKFEERKTRMKIFEDRD